VNIFRVQKLVLSLITINLLIPGFEVSYAQNPTENGSSANSQVLISKTSLSNTIISNGSSTVAGFDTTYTMTGSADDIKNSKDLISKIVIDDFNDSSTIGYVNLNHSSETNDSRQIGNPFASNEQISQKIQEQLDRSILDTDNATTQSVSITCNFGSNLGTFLCSVNPLQR
jgi:hypothetical protein